MEHLNTWVVNEKKKTFVQNGKYTPEPLEESHGTGIRVLLGKEGAFSCCSSGSRWYETFSGLRALDSRSNDWLTIVLTPAIKEESVIVIPTIDKKLIAIRDAFGLSIASLASIVGTSRASVYNWLEGKIPTERFNQRIDSLYNLAEKWQEKNQYHYPPGRLVKQKLGNRLSFYEYLCRDELNLDEIYLGMNSLIELMNKQRVRMDRAKLRSAKVSEDFESHKETLGRITGSVSMD